MSVEDTLIGMEFRESTDEQKENLARELFAELRKAVSFKDLKSSLPDLGYTLLESKPLGVTGEVAEHVAAEKLGLTLVTARTIGYDTLRGEERIQIKGRAL